jgi:hypothetical protein
VQAKPARPRLHLLLLLHPLTAVRLLQRLRTASLSHLRRRKRHMMRAVALTDIDAGCKQLIHKAALAPAIAFYVIKSMLLWY